MRGRALRHVGVYVCLNNHPCELDPLAEPLSVHVVQSDGADRGVRRASGGGGVTSCSQFATSGLMDSRRPSLPPSLQLSFFLSAAYLTKALCDCLHAAQPSSKLHADGS